MHDPVALLAFWSSSSVENQSLLHAHETASFGAVNLPVFSSGLPVSSLCCPISSQSGWVLSVSEAKEVPLFLTHLRFLCQHKETNLHLEFTSDT